ncbi:uncharacterized protein MELLADRAFT_67295 [Melampsora larici-populina 98AG31]|uniref:Uncharacterized protein n=1 Tax=Melampsora larici-populina (strain 98AG31 / pathotype 3-4-7) TaxID=747676 RepID=F4S2W2_MELLP|nr:uncharacterized protein MELLADRAFT_67295 [Melampsora larici-populina 98AG31]EGG01013.1 hypothetical protein MELLADRAFT_67295 [Melampsora larici-populina 98AG31]
MAEHRNDLFDLPRSLANLEAKVQELAQELGNAELANAQRGGGRYSIIIIDFGEVKPLPDDQMKAIMTVQVSMGFLYEAKYDVIQQRANAAIRTVHLTNLWRTSGATQQPRNEQLRKKKAALLKTKTDTYLRHARKYNEKFQPAHRLLEPTYDEVVNMDILDPFWDEAALNHPDEAWSSCQSTKEGIIAFQSERSCKEELRQLGREVRQLMLWGLDYQARVDASKPNIAIGEGRMVEWNSIYKGLSRISCRLWQRWSRGLSEVMHSTSQYVEQSANIDQNLMTQWEEMVARTSITFAEIIGVPMFIAHEDGEDDLPEIEEEEEPDLAGDFFGLFIS